MQRGEGAAVGRAPRTPRLCPQALPCAGPPASHAAPPCPAKPGPGHWKPSPLPGYPRRGCPSGLRQEGQWTEGTPSPDRDTVQPQPPAWALQNPRPPTVGEAHACGRVLGRVQLDHPGAAVRWRPRSRKGSSLLWEARQTEEQVLSHRHSHGPGTACPHPHPPSPL